jgi:hypothetical protein
MTRGLAGACLFGFSWLLIACDSDDASGGTPTVPTIEISSLASSEGYKWSAEPDASDPELTLPCDGNIAVGVTTEHWSARAPGACGQTQACGHTEAVITIDNRASDPAFAVANPLLRLPENALADWVGRATLLARLVHDDNSPYLDAAGEAIADTVNVTFSAAVDCSSTGGSPTGGAGGAGGAAN